MLMLVIMVVSQCRLMVVVGEDLDMVAVTAETLGDKVRRGQVIHRDQPLMMKDEENLSVNT